MKKLKHLWFDLMHPRWWSITLTVQHFFLKIRDYDRLDYDYSQVLYHATSGKMSKTNYDLQTVFDIIDETQNEFQIDAEREILDLIKEGADINEIKELLENK